MIKIHMEQNSIWKYDNAHTQVSKTMWNTDVINVKFPVQIQENLKKSS